MNILCQTRRKRENQNKAEPILLRRTFMDSIRLMVLWNPVKQGTISTHKYTDIDFQMSSWSLSYRVKILQD